MPRIPLAPPPAVGRVSPDKVPPFSIVKVPSALVFFVCCTLHASAATRLPEIFAPGMVLQKSAATPVWGWSEPEGQVRVSVGPVTAETRAGGDGKWVVGLDLTSIGPGPHEMTVNEVKLPDVLVGEVWLCGGQSNMEYKLGETLDAAKVIESSANPQIRQFLVPRRAEDDPAADIRGTWMQAGPADSGKFTAVGYYFARELHRELGVPIGLINASWGASACETWMSGEGIASVDGLTAGVAAMEKDYATYADRHADFLRKFRQWLDATGHADAGKWTAADVRGLPDGQWTPVKLPAPVPASKEPGVMWLRRTVDIPDDAAGQPLGITFGTIQMLEDVWWNGEKVGGTTLEAFKTGRNPRKHEVPGRLVKKGANEILVRIWSPAKTPHFDVWEESFKAGRVSLVGQWQMVREHVHPPAGQEPPAAPRETAPIQNAPSRAFNGMIAPLVPYGIAGVIWYQGENNAPRAQQYHDTFPALVRDWRRLWKRDDLPFLWCQLSAHKKKLPVPAESAWAELREAQTKTLALPHTGQALTLDVGEAGDIHPRNKAVPGARLAGIALAAVYGRESSATGPVFAGVTLGNGKAIVRFADVAGGLVAAPVPDSQIITSIPPKKEPLVRNSPDSPLEGFAISGTDGEWKWADAVIDGDTVVVWNPQVPEPVAVRYAWADNPTANLFGKNGLPAAPFRTDNFPLTTAGKVYPP